MNDAKEVEFKHRGVPRVVRGALPEVHYQGAQALVTQGFFSADPPDAPDLIAGAIVRYGADWQPHGTRSEQPPRARHMSAA